VNRLLVDHAHCELKAAANALSLAARHARDVDLALALTDLAREEIAHFQRVLGALAARGLSCGPPPEDGYAAALRQFAAKLPRSPHASPLVDRLLIGALIEARSCERFKLLADAIGDDGPHGDLRALWKEFFASEAQHYGTFVDLAVRAAAGDRPWTIARLEELARIEAQIVSKLGLEDRGRSRATVHG
jgi:tRNA-(ms[2]io[6]A)-hydroxylase